MLVYPRPSVHLSQSSDAPPSPTPSNTTSRYTLYNTLPFATSTSTSTSSSLSETATQKIARAHLSVQPSSVPAGHLSYPSSSTATSAPAVAAATDSQGLNETYMTSAYDFQNPAIRLQQSTPVTQLSAAYASSPLSAISGVDTQSWSMFGPNNSHLAASPSLATSSSSSRRNRTGTQHQRGTSSSSAGSSGSPAQYSIAYPPFSNHLPTPSQTPTQDSFLATTFPTYTSQPPALESSMAAHMAMKQALLDQNAVGDDELPGFGHSGRQSVSSFGHESPATPHTAHGEDLDDKYKMPSNDVLRAPTIPKLNRTMTDIFQDELYHPANTAQIQAPSSQQQNSSLLSPYRNFVVTERMHAAEQARAHSPISRDVSPFRQGASHAAVYDGYGSPHSNLRVSNAMHLQQQTRGDAYALKQMVKVEDSEPKTISPKEAMLDYRPEETESQMPLFSSSNPSAYETQYGNGAAHPMGTSSGATQSGLVVSVPTPPQSNFTFTHPTMTMGFSNLPQYSAAQPYRTATSMPTVSDPTPDFPAHLTSMESSASEAGPADSSSNNGDLQKPTSSLADSGTYSCTYHGCVLRFDTPQKLQRHKRESHRNAATAVDIPALGGGMTSSAAASALMTRNSQAGPHKCERINPTTGKPCNTIFSRPYDLTRHEDTIHNSRKQKVKCALCSEEKTFSRNDALTRHMRVVHPDVDFPGKHRRRGGNHD